jgi:serine/threonine protein kinase
MLSVIGKGSYGKVLLVKKNDSAELYAMKVLKKSEILRRNQVEHTMTERRILVSRYGLSSVGISKAPIHC